MAKLKRGINGFASGKLGNVVMVDNGDQQIVRARPSGPRKFSEGQLAHQASMAIRQNWINGIREFLAVGCKNDFRNTGGTALALSYMSAHALSGKGADTVVHPETMLVSIGDLPQASGATAGLEGNEVVFTWEASSEGKASALDDALLLAYDVNNARAAYRLEGYFRRDGEARLKLLGPGTYHCYLGFRAKDNSIQSNSQYLGALSL